MAGHKREMLYSGGRAQDTPRRMYKVHESQPTRVDDSRQKLRQKCNDFAVFCAELCNVSLQREHVQRLMVLNRLA